MELKGETIDENNYSWSGTGFLAEDGKFITARHCIQSWRFTNKEMDMNMLVAMYEEAGVLPKITFIAVSQLGGFEFEYKDVVLQDNSDQQKSITMQDGSAYSYKTASEVSTDWAYVPTGKQRASTIVQDVALSTRLQAGSKGIVLGYPLRQGVSVSSGKLKISPVFSELSFAQDGLNGQGMIGISNRGFESGNSGGPVFAADANGNFVVVGIVSHSLYDTSLGGIVPIANVK